MTRMIINEAHIDKNKLKLSASIVCPFDLEVTSPKVKIIFECDGKTRRVPFLVTSYFRQKQNDTCVIVCSYTFLLDKLFYNLDSDSDIRAHIDLIYGGSESSSLPFRLSRFVLEKNPELEVSPDMIVEEVSDGVTSYSADDSDYEIDKEKHRNIYGLDFDFESNELKISNRLGRYSEKNLVQKSFVLVPLLRFVMFVLRLVLSVALLPYFIIDGALAALGVVPKRRTQEIDGLFKNIFVQIKINISSFIKTSFKRANFVNNIRRPIFAVCSVYYKILCRKPVKGNRVTFMSGRRDELGGNPEFVYNILKDMDDIEFKFLLFSDPAGHNKVGNIVKFLKLYASSRVVIVDDYFRLLNIVQKRDDVKLFQLWHACGAFKTFGFTRLGKKGGPKQVDPNHRMYDYAIVSSQEIAKHYAEGFGLSDENVVATGIPRTDIFMDKQYEDSVVTSFYEKYPQLRGKKIMLFAPTFRGNGQMSAFYPTAMFNPAEVYDRLGGEYAILIKLHPFCQERFEIPEQYSDYIIDLSEEDELNDLLFVTDLLVTDYSSVIFEASLRDIPMVFYAFDLYSYISTRDFYYDFESFVPGKIVFTESELVKAVETEDFCQDKVDSFKNKFFDHLDGKSSQRVADLILSVLKRD